MTAGLTLLVDSASMIYRAYFAVPETVRAPDGQPVNGAYGFLNMLARLLRELRPAAVACAWDDDWRPAWRVELIESYKSHRVAGPNEAADDAVERQTAIVAEILELAGVPALGCADYEAEDVIGTLVQRARGEVAIVSGDRDLFQLVRDPDVYVLYPKRGVSDLLRVDEAEIRNRYGIPGGAYADFAVLRGDPSDGLPGVRGIGEKTAATLIARYGSIEGVLEAARAGGDGVLSKVRAAADYVERAVKVVTIDGTAPVQEADIRLGRRAPDPSLQEVAERYGLTGPVERLLSSLLEIR